MAVHYIEPTQLALMLKGPDRNSVVVIDVRDDDFNYGGHISGALNLSAHLFADPSNVAQIIKHCCGEKVEKVVVHCMMSEVRAPRVARKIADALHSEGRSSPDVLVLRRGFNTFGTMFRADPELVTTEFPGSDPMDSW